MISIKIDCTHPSFYKLCKDLLYELMLLKVSKRACMALVLKSKIQILSTMYFLKIILKI